MNFEALENYITAYKREGKRMFTTSSFQSHSLVLLHMLSRIDPSIPVIFINTGYHFPETVAFRDQIAKQFGMNVVDLKSRTPRNMQKDHLGKLLYASDPDHCCYVNKTQPLESILV